jgi:Uma2 family endonuclease
MASAAVPILYHDETRGEDFRIPAEAHSFAGFRSWSHSDQFPERGRIDYLAGEIEVDMSPEKLYTHGAVKTAVGARLHVLVAERDLGTVYIDRTRVASPSAELSVEPDITVVLWSSLEAGRLREIPSVIGSEGDYVELEGPPDLVVEIVSDSSVRKDTRRLPPLYAAAGVPELWLVDARRDDLRFDIHQLVAGSYQRLTPDADGWIVSPLLGRSVRLTRHRTPFNRWAYELEHALAA